ncbi:ABC transporter permease [Cellulomonas sp. PhB143]|uniref:ABC transporter permease n=1 Tax=Cellulomonas sp. PhB143 TaxID=2485186 RepID=UPI000F48909C|nr:ABC transporter permease [Cellulomonas sp. PhB143]ROS78641.1 ABC-2 type transport system permease protein [Cellulomonas sp. PhB143]
MTATDAAARPTPRETGIRLTFAGTVRSEWIKLRTLRSTWWVVASTVVVMALIALLTSWTFTSFSDDPEFAAQSGGTPAPMELVTSGTTFAQLVLAVLAVLTITNEFSSGMIRSTFAADPGRSATVWAKALVLLVVSLVVAVVGVVVAYLVAWPFLNSSDMLPDLGSSDSLQVAGGTVAYLVLSALMALGLAGLIRSTAGSIFTVVALVFVAPPILSLISNDTVQSIAQYLPSNAGTSFMTVSAAMSGGAQTLDPVPGLLVMVAWAVVPMVAANVVVKRRDA